MRCNRYFFGKTCLSTFFTNRNNLSRKDRWKKLKYFLNSFFFFFLFISCFFISPFLLLFLIFLLSWRGMRNPKIPIKNSIFSFSSLFTLTLIIFPNQLILTVK